ncbi:T9SS type A sorting domain-containing protein [Labilibacter marinus]|uniref:T9SS type A sorting domain-containing protein n=1 Tax=Labilibacter marinus TaxID=1477105 RepID=UPI000950348B|nr:T9SS type A sorting domain-containing protein [Labilibacter marinus]
MKRLIALIVWCVLMSNIDAQNFIADHVVANEEVLRIIPKEFIDKARNELKIAYQHTSHGTHVSRGMFGLPDYKPGDDELFAITNDNPQAGKLEFHDYALADYAPQGVDAADLSREETAFIQTTRNYLDAPENAEINVVMWSWCDIKGHNATGNYLPGMQSLIDEYGEGGSKIGTGEGKTRVVPVHFIFMTGHANRDDNIGDGKPKNQADLINNYCIENEYFCLDYYAIDSHDMTSAYWDDAGDDGNSTNYGGTEKFYQDYEDSKSIGDGFYENKREPNGMISRGSHTTQHITSNRKAYAMWWILTRIAGWDGLANSDIAVNEVKMDDLAYFDHLNKRLIIKDQEGTIGCYCKLYDLEGKLVKSDIIDGTIFSMSDITAGAYVMVLESDNLKTSKKIVIQ